MRWKKAKRKILIASLILTLMSGLCANVALAESADIAETGQTAEASGQTVHGQSAVEIPGETPAAEAAPASDVSQADPGTAPSDEEPAVLPAEGTGSPDTGSGDHCHDLASFRRVSE